jgi:hypothetical protein
MRTSSVFSVVTGDSDEDRLLAYLYAHTECVAALTCGKRTAYLLRTTTTVTTQYPASHGTLSAFDRALYLARCQTQRLASGLYGINCVGVSDTAAWDAIREFLDFELSRFELDATTT